MSVPIRYKVRNLGALTRAVSLVAAPGSDLSTLSLYAGKELGLWELEAAAIDIMRRAQVEYGFAMYCLVQTHVWPLLLVMRKIDAQVAKSIAGFSTTNIPGRGVLTFEVGKPDPISPQIQVGVIVRRTDGYMVGQSDGNMYFVPIVNVDRMTVRYLD